MSKDAIKKLMIFLVINLFLSVLIVAVNNDSDIIESKKDNNLISENKNQVTLDNNVVNKKEEINIVDKKEEINIVDKKEEINVVDKKEEINVVNKKEEPSQKVVNKEIAKEIIATTEPVCVKIGPLGFDNKNTLDFILSKTKESNLAIQEKKVFYQIYWDLGEDKDKAIELFKKQKEGAMADKKFFLEKFKNKYVVNITKIDNDKTIAENLTKDLAEKADKLNTGGEWKYEGIYQYYYIFSDYQKLMQKTINNIDVILKPKKEPC